MAFELRRRFCQKRCQPSWVSKRCISQKTFGGRQDNVAPIRFAGGDGTRNVDDREGRPVIAPCGLSGASAAPFTVHIQGAIEQAEAGHAAADQVRMARDMSIMFDELKALADKHAAVHANQARLQAELEQARAELAKARRPW